MGLLLNLSINLSKIDKSKIVKGKDGAQYYDITVSVNDTPNSYGQDVAAFDKQSKEEREAKSKNYLGNGKVFWRSAPKEEQQETPEPKGENGLPF